MSAVSNDMNLNLSQSINGRIKVLLLLVQLYPTCAIQYFSTIFFHTLYKIEKCVAKLNDQRVSQFVHCPLLQGSPTNFCLFFFCTLTVYSHSLIGKDFQPLDMVSDNEHALNVRYERTKTSQKIYQKKHRTLHEPYIA